MIKSGLEAAVDKIYFKIGFNWAEVLFYGFFLAYGFFAAATPSYTSFLSNFTVVILQFILICFFLVTLGIFGWKYDKNYADHLTFSVRDLIVLIIIFVFLFSLAYGSLGQSIQGDESAYLMLAFGHAIKILLKFGNYSSLLNVFTAKYLIQLISLLLIVAVILFIYLSRKLVWPIRICVVLSILFLCRLSIMYFGGNPSPHPPLAGVINLIFGSIFGLNDFALKSGYFAGYALFIFAVYKMANREMPIFVSLLFAISVGTIPLTLHLAAIVESSVWSLICFTLVMMELVTNKNPNFIRLVSFVSLITLFRQSSFIGYIPILILYAALMRKPYLYNVKKTIPAIILPSILFVPFLIQSMFHGTPSTLALGDGVGQLDRVFQAWGSGVVLVAIANSVPIWWILFMPFTFFNSKRHWVHGLAFLVFFVVALAMYYAINPGLYGLGKYQAEYAVPFGIVGAYMTIERVILVFNSKVVLTLLSLIIGLNTIEYYKIPLVNKPVDILVDTMAHDASSYDSGYHILCGFPYEFKQAYSEIKTLGLTSNAYTIGVTYGVFLEIINGYSFSALREVESISRGQKKLNQETNYDFSAVHVLANIEKDSRIKAVILGAIYKKNELIDEFIRHGWVKHKTYQNTEYGSSVTIMKKIQIDA